MKWREHLDNALSLLVYLTGWMAIAYVLLAILLVRVVGAVWP